MRKILSIDFDNTLCYDAFPDIQNAKRKFIHKIILWYIKYKQKTGWYIILNTCRSGEYLIVASMYLRKLNFIPDLINENAEWLIKKYSDTRKISCNLNIDDTNFGLLGFILRLYKKEN